MLTHPSWLVDATGLPLAFALVREDPLLDLDVLHTVKAADARVAMIASGGCTAAVLAAHVAHLHLIDANPAQLALTRFKLHLLQTATPAQRLELLGHQPLSSAERRNAIIAVLDELDLAHDCFGPVARVAEWGPDYSGRYERLFAQLRQRLGHDAAWEQLLCLADPSAQTKQVMPDTSLGHSMDEIYDEVFSQANLVQLFGESATHNRVEPFSRHFARRTRQAFATFPANSNPYLWLMLRGRLPANRSLPWLTQPLLEKMPGMEYTVGLMGQVLDGTTNTYDFIHLSNILDWLTPDQARQTLASVWNALRPGGAVFIRQLNSTLDITSLGAAFVWDTSLADELLQHDRSFFYRALHLGRKQ